MPLLDYRSTSILHISWKASSHFVSPYTASKITSGSPVTRAMCFPKTVVFLLCGHRVDLPFKPCHDYVYLSTMKTEGLPQAQTVSDVLAPCSNRHLEGQTIEKLCPMCERDGGIREVSRSDKTEPPHSDNDDIKVRCNSSVLEHGSWNLPQLLGICDDTPASRREHTLEGIAAVLASFLVAIELYWCALNSMMVMLVGSAAKGLDMVRCKVSSTTSASVLDIRSSPTVDMI